MVDTAHIERIIRHNFDITGSYEIQEDGSVNVQGDVSLRYPQTDGMIPIKFGVVDGVFKVYNKGIKSLKNAPDVCASLIVAGNFLTSLEHCPEQLNMLDVCWNQLTSFVHAPDQVNKIIAFGNPFTSLKGLPESEFEISITYDAKLPLLRLIAARKVTIRQPPSLPPFEPVNSMINKYLGQGKPGAIKCAAELIKAGFKENARW